MSSILRSRLSRVLAGVVLALGPALFVSAAAHAQQQQGEPLPLRWEMGPQTVAIGSELAEIDLPEGFVFLGKEDTQRLMRQLENPVSGDELGTLAPAADDEQWFLVFEWEAIGWVDDSEKDSLDADAMLASIQEGNQHSNKERAKRGWSTLDILGWQESPYYDVRTNNLTWAVKASSEGQLVINRNIKVLGRRGVMTVTLVSGPDELVSASAQTDRLLEGYRFQQGSTYAEYIPGTDSVAKYGLTALVVGGAGAALLKSGLLARFWKFIAVGAVGLVAAVKRIIFGRSHIQDPPTSA